MSTIRRVFAVVGRVLRAIRRGLRALPRLLVRDLRAAFRRLLRKIRWAAGGMFRFVRSLPGRAVRLVKAMVVRPAAALIRFLISLPGRIVRWVLAAPGRLLRFLRSLPGRLVSFVRSIPARIRFFLLGDEYRPSLPIRRWHAFRRRPKRHVAGAFLVSAIAYIILTGTELPPPQAVTVQTGVIEIDVPEAVPVDESFFIGIAGATPDQELAAMVELGYGVRRFSATTDADGEARIEVPPIGGPGSRTALVTVTQDDLGAMANLMLEPGPPADPIDVYLGPRTVIADAAHFIMEVAIPEDEWGNPVAEGTDVVFTVTRPNQVVETETRPTEDLLSWFEVFSRTVTGRTRISAVAGEAGAAERTFLEVAGIPAPFEVELVDPMLPADGQALLRVMTEVLVDPFGNELPDGTVVYLDARGVTGTRRIHSQTVDGRAEFTLEVPDRPGPVTLMAIASGTESEPLELVFETAVESMTAEVEVTDRAAMVHVGPVRSVRGSYVPEGAIARVTLDDGSTAIADLSLGVGTAFFPADADMSVVRVEVLGTEIRVRG